MDETLAGTLDGTPEAATTAWDGDQGTWAGAGSAQSKRQPDPHVASLPSMPEAVRDQAKGQPVPAVSGGTASGVWG